MRSPTGSQALRDAAGELGMPAAYTTAVSGRGRELERTFTEFGWAFLLSIAFMYMVLAAQYESLLNPFIILLSLPLSLPFALLSLYLTRRHAQSLLRARHARAVRRRRQERDPADRPHAEPAASGHERAQAILEANRDRLRPILMTTLALVGGMLPLALGTGPGAEERRTIAVVVIGGQTLSLFLTLVVIPVAYSLFDDLAAALVAGARRAIRSNPRPSRVSALRDSAKVPGCHSARVPQCARVAEGHAPKVLGPPCVECYRCTPAPRHAGTCWHIGTDYFAKSVCDVPCRRNGSRSRRRHARVRISVPASRSGGQSSAAAALPLNL